MPTYLQKVKAESNNLYFIILAIISITIITTILTIDISPFKVYGMYGIKEKNVDTLNMYVLQYNEGNIYDPNSIIEYHNKLLFLFTAEHYDNYVKEGGDPWKEKSKLRLQKIGIQNAGFLDKIFMDKSDIDKYPDWLKKYESTNIDEEVNNINLYKLKVAYTENHRLKTIDSTLIFHQ